MRTVFTALVVLLLLTTGPEILAQTCVWQSVGNGFQGSGAAFAVFDDGTGEALYAAGNEWTTVSGGEATTHLNKWDGSAWTTVLTVNGSITAMTVFDDGGGACLYVCGGFSSMGGVPAINVAKWDGTNWSALGGGVMAAAMTAAVFDDGSGPAYYVGGLLAVAGGISVNGIAKWDGVSWSSVGSQSLWTMTNLRGAVNALAVHDDGSGPALYAGGDFMWLDSPLGGLVPTNFIARFDGATWTTLGQGAQDVVTSLATFDDGTGPRLYVGVDGTPLIERWGGGSWTPVGSGLLGNWISPMVAFDDGSGPALYVGGKFSNAGGVAANCMAKWDGLQWSSTGYTLNTLGASVYGACVFDDGSGPAIYASQYPSGMDRLLCASSLSISSSQLGGPGAQVFVNNANLTPGHEYYNLFSLDLCPSGPGAGWFGGLCISTPANLQFIQVQLERPLDMSQMPLFHFTATSSYVTWGPMLLPPVTLDAICFDFTGGTIGPVSPVTRITIQ